MANHETQSKNRWNPWNWFQHEDEEQRRVSQQTGNPRYLPSLFGEDPFWRTNRDLNRLVENMYARAGFGEPRRTGGQSLSDRLSEAVLRPDVDIKETKKDYRIMVEVPGIEQDDIHIELQDHTLTVSGEKKHEREEEGDNYHTTERSYGSFRRLFTLPEDVREQDIDAEFKNGLLKITIPRREIRDKNENEEPKVIEIRHAA